MLAAFTRGGLWEAQWVDLRGISEVGVTLTNVSGA